MPDGTSATRRGRTLAASTLAIFLFAPRDASGQSPQKAPPSIAIGDAALTPVVDLRLRGELRADPPDMGGRDPQTGALAARVRTAVAGLERARLGALVESGAVRGRLVLEDARVWGTESSDGVFGPYEAWIEAHTASVKPWSLRVGRQSVAWGEGLLLGAADFAPVGRALDAIRGQAQAGPIEIEALASILVAPRPQSPTLGINEGPWGSGAQLYGLRGAWPIDPMLRVELAGLARIARTGEGGGDFAIARGEGEIYTGSLRASGDANGLAYGAECAYQFGRAARVAAEGATRSAVAGFAHVGKTFESWALVPSIRIGGAYASGDPGNGGNYTQFDPILPDVNVHFGAMNAFAWSNTFQLHARAGITPWADARLAVEYRYVRLAEAKGEWLNGDLRSVGRDPGSGEAELGHELDVLLTYVPWPILELRAGYAGVLWGDGARTILASQARGSYDRAFNAFVPSDLSHYGYLQARLRLP
jgi:hypothetical protein